ncbi:MAG: SUMF1/EgtB/PvdO family nonheme iron enzyme [Planctomycetota bacterium]
MSLTTMISDSITGLLPAAPAIGHQSNTSYPSGRGISADVRRLVRDHRYGKLLCSDASVPFDQASLRCAAQALRHDMVQVRQGEVNLVDRVADESPEGFTFHMQAGTPTAVPSFYMDRLLVTHRDFSRFVDAGGYSDESFWPESLRGRLPQFTDRTRHVGPATWSDGSPPADKLDHPVTGLCWFEASAYASWCGKQLATSPQWQRAATWTGAGDGGTAEPRYPWGNSYNPRNANLWSAGFGETIPATQQQGDTPTAGIQQLIGNVWEWVDAQFVPAGTSAVTVQLAGPMAEIRGGAFDTYFENQATSQFRTGMPIMSRPDNVGFRCVIPSDRLPSGFDQLGVDNDATECDPRVESDL